jgi:U32 family peptidase
MPDKVTNIKGEQLPPASCLPELLAPAGDWECARAAVENGADAIYFGLERFNARMRAHNFTEADLPALMTFLHRRGVKGYVTFNTLVFENELADAEQHLRAIIAAGVDAAIVQDVGICRLIRRLSPDFPIHASTQMTVTSKRGVEFAKELGCNLVVLARECSIKEIEKIRSNFAPRTPDLSTGAGLPLEVFVHGALCVAYSGQCLTSEALGGRSANRGECAQACRMPYTLLCDGQPVPLGDKKYLLSPQDLAGLEILPELVNAGVSSLKIEGRLKSPEYVANITRVYRQALDGLRSTSSQPDEGITAQSAQYDLEMGFSRGLYTGWFQGINNQALVHARFGKKRGVFLGDVSRVQGKKVFLKLRAPLKPGDGVVFDAGHPEEDEQGGRVYQVQYSKPNATLPDEAEMEFGRGDVDLTRVHVGDKVWKTSDPELDRRLRQTFAGEQPRFRQPIHMEVHGRAEQPLILIARDAAGHTVQVASVIPLAKAQNQPLSSSKLAEQVGRLGGTPFKLGDFNNLLEGEVILPVSELNRMRREVATALEGLRTEPRRWTLNAPTAPGLHPDKRSTDRSKAGSPELIVLVRNLLQLEAALQCNISTVYCDFEDPKKYREAVCRAREVFASTGPEKSIWVAPPRIFKMGEEWILEQVRSAGADGYLVRNYDHLRFYTDCRCIGDYSLNVANNLAADHFKVLRLERLTPSYDLNAIQLQALLESAPPEWFEVTIHQHIPMFHMEHCVFCAFLSKGTDYTNCGRPCDKHDVRLRDRVGADHLLKADVGCRNTVFNGLAQTGAEYVKSMLSLGLKHFRIEFVSETPDQVSKTIGMYQLLLRNEISGAQLWRELKLVNQLGVTRGSIDKR